MKATLGDAKPECAEDAGFCETDPRLVKRINIAQRRLLHMGKWVGTYQHYRFCAPSGCVTLPRQLETLETVAQCGWPGTLRNEWFEYVRDGFGLSGHCSLNYQDQGEGHVAFEDVIGLNKVLRVYSDTAETGSPTILLQFWNQNRIPVRTEYPAGSGIWINGERVVISTTQTNTVNQCMAGGLVAVQKPLTKGTVFIYEYDTVTLAQRLLAIYEPDETRPDYRRYVIPFSAQSGDCSSQIVDVIAKRRFIPAVDDEDWLIIGNTDAVAMACRAVRLEKNLLFSDALVPWALARQILDDELAQFQGDGSQDVIQMVDEFSNASVENLI